MIPPLLKAGIAHVQFETIHPFLDGNGRIGRMLIVLMLVNDGLICEPLLYPSYYFKKYRSEYYARLDDVRTKGDWEGWIKYYLRAISATAADAHSRAQEIETINDDMTQRIIDSNLMRKKDDATLLLSWLFQHPIVTVNDVAEKLGKSYPVAQNLVSIFEKLGILSVDQGQQRNRLYKFSSYIMVLENNFLM